MLDVIQNGSLQHRGLKLFLETAFVFLAYLIAGKLGQATADIRSSNLGPVWPAYGVALAAILICGYRVWPGVLIGAFVVAFFSPVSHLAALGQATGATLAATSGAFVLHRLANFNRSLSRLTDALSLIFLGGFGSATVSASIGILVLFATHVHAYSGLGGAWLIYWLGDATGVLLVTPLALRATDFLELRNRDRIVELVALVLLLVVTCLVIFGDLASIPIKLHVMAFAVLPFIIWAAMRFGLGVTAFTVVVVATIATVETALGTGPFTSNTTFVNAVLLDIFFGVLSVSGLSLAAVISEREYAERQREQVIAKQAALEAQVQAQEALRASEERLRLAQWAAHIGTFDLNLRTGVDIWPPETEALYGLPPGGFGGTLAAFEDMIHPDDRKKIIELTQEMMRTGQPAQGEWRVVWPDGSVHWIAGRGQVLMDESGKPCRMLGVNMDVTERKRAEEAIKESETRFRLVADTAPVMIWMSGLDKKPTYFNQLWLDFTGFSDIDLQNRLAEIVHPEDYLQCHEVYCRGFDQRQPFRKECRLRRHDGQYRWMLDIGVPRFNKDGSFAGYIGSCIDVTEHKEAEKALEGMSRKLIEAQEQERTRIARELHDDINQRLALLSVELEATRQNPPDTATDVSILLTEIRERINEISGDVQSISHRLHSSQLEYLGIVAAVRSFCREFSTAQNVEVNFRHDDIPRSLPQNVSLCLFRVLQEALHNAFKYSQVRHFAVHLTYAENQLGLTISDHGIGFDSEAAMSRGGLGLTSMRERVRLVNGTITIDSKPMGGTTIHVRVPLPSDSERAAG